MQTVNSSLCNIYFLIIKSKTKKVMYEVLNENTD